MSQKTKEMPVYDRSIKVLRTRRRPGEKLGSKIETSGRRLSPVPDGTGPRETWNFRIANPNKPNRLKFLWVNQIDGFRPKQTQVIYLPCCQSDTAKLGPVFGKKWMVMTDQGFRGRHLLFLHSQKRILRGSAQRPPQNDKVGYRKSDFRGSGIFQASRTTGFLRPSRPVFYFSVVGQFDVEAALRRQLAR